MKSELINMKRPWDKEKNLSPQESLLLLLLRSLVQILLLVWSNDTIIFVNNSFIQSLFTQPFQCIEGRVRRTAYE